MSSADEHYPLPDELADLEADLASLVPCSGGLDRDRLLFEAGQAAARNRQGTGSQSARWLWSAGGGAVAGAAAMLLVMLGLDFRALRESADMSVDSPRDEPVVREERSQPPAFVRRSAPQTWRRSEHALTVASVANGRWEQLARQTHFTDQIDAQIDGDREDRTGRPAVLTPRSWRAFENYDQQSAPTSSTKPRHTGTSV